jgi:glycosyltransferase involved in cell wall biosynthesis
MINIAIVTRSTLYTNPGGDTVQIQETVAHLSKMGVQADIFLTNNNINFDTYDIVHFFNLIRPADIIRHLKKINVPLAVSPVLVDYSEFDKYYRKGFQKMFFSYAGAGTIEYLKTAARWLMGKDMFPGFFYLLNGHSRSMKLVLGNTKMLLPNSDSELQKCLQLSPAGISSHIVPNGVNTEIFNGAVNDPGKDASLIICAARIEGIKNQLTLIRALNNTKYKLMLIGAPSAGASAYYKQCRKEAADNIIFTGQLTQSELKHYYQRAKVHILPSWFETCGLSSLEAASLNCNIVITSKGFAKDYFGANAYYCDPASEVSVFNAVEQAVAAPVNHFFSQHIRNEFTWMKAAAETLKAYQTLLDS